MAEGLVSVSEPKSGAGGLQAPQPATVVCAGSENTLAINLTHIRPGGAYDSAELRSQVQVNKRSVELANFLLPEELIPRLMANVHCYTGVSERTL
jgi:hypothetical protein